MVCVWWFLKKKKKTPSGTQTMLNFPNFSESVYWHLKSSGGEFKQLLLLFFPIIFQLLQGIVVLRPRSVRQRDLYALVVWAVSESSSPPPSSLSLSLCFHAGGAFAKYRCQHIAPLKCCLKWEVCCENDKAEQSEVCPPPSV